jgi:hypothetical protein
MHEVNQKYDQTARWQHILGKAKGPQITVMNEHDSEGPPTDFTYIDECVFADDVPKFNMEFLISMKLVKI